MKIKTILAIMPALFLLLTGEVQAQGKYGADSVNCIKNISLYREFFQQKNYKDAFPYWRMVYNECPASTEHMYVDGPTLMRWAMQNETDPARKAAYTDSILAIYDQRIMHFGKEGYVLGRKAMELVSLTPENQADAYSLLKKAHELEGSKLDAGAAFLWFQAATILLSQEKIEVGEAMKVYEYAMQSAAAKTSSYNQQNQQRIEQLFVNSPLASCDIMLPMFQSQFDAAPEDVELMKKITAALGEKCADSELYIKVSTALDKAEPSAESAYAIARMHYSRNSFGNAAKFYESAIERETDNQKKAQYYYELAASQVKQGNNSAARSSAQRAASLRPNWGLPHLLIADIIASTKDCGDNPVSQGSVFWLAVDKLQYAKSVDPSVAADANSKISTYTRYFPSEKDIFFYTLKEGQDYTVPCLGETTKVRIP